MVVVVLKLLAGCYLLWCKYVVVVIYYDTSSGPCVLLLCKYCIIVVVLVVFAISVLLCKYVVLYW